MDVRTMTEFHVLLDETLQECHELLKKVIGTHTTLYEIILWWLNAINVNMEGSVRALPQPLTATDTVYVDHVYAVFKLSWSIL
jgi:hypothetical protein